MKIVSTTNVSRKHEERLQRTFPDDTFIFTANMEEGRRFLSLINLSRGPVVNEEAMIKVLQEKRIAHYL